MSYLLRDRFISRLKDGLQGEHELFGTFEEALSSSSICSFIDSVLSFLASLKGDSLVCLYCNDSIESVLASFLLVFSRHDSLFLPNDEQSASLLLDELVADSSNTYLLACGDILGHDTRSRFAQVLDCSLSIKKTKPLSGVVQHLDRLSSEIPGKSIYTSSGSTGNPKIIPLMYENIESCYKSIASLFDIRHESEIICLHNTSFVILLPFLFLFCGCKRSCILAKSCDRLTVSSIIQFRSCRRSLKSTVIVSVPTMLRLLLELKAPISMGSGVIISCGEPLDSGLAKALKDTRPDIFYNMYGCTEVAPWIFGLNVLKYMDARCSDALDSILPIGNALVGVEYKITPSQELCVSGDMVFTGYLTDPYREPFAEYNGMEFFNTGDIIDVRDGCTFCLGRSNSAVKVAGQFINPVLIEAELKRNDDQYDYVCIANISPPTLSIIVLGSDQVSSLKEEEDASIRDATCRVTKVRLPVRIIRVNAALKRLSSGKIDRAYYTSKYKQKANAR